MKEFRFRLILILASIVLCVYLLLPTYQDWQNSKQIKQILNREKTEIEKSDSNITLTDLNKMLRYSEDSILVANPSFQKDREKRLKLGLDLQGGMRVVLEVNTGKLLEKLAKDPDDTFRKVINGAEKEARLSNESIVDLVGKSLIEKGIRLSRYFGSIREDDAKILSGLKQDAEDAVTRAMEIIRNRVDQYGVSEPSIQRQGNRRIIVELPGVAREEEAKQLLQGTALLEFRLLKDPQLAFSIMQKIDNVLAGESATDSTSESNSENNNEVKSDTTKSEDSTAQENLTQEEFMKKHPFFSLALIDPQGRSADAYVYSENRNKLQLLLNRPDVKKVIPSNVDFLFSAKPEKGADGKEYYRLYTVNKEPELTGGVVTDAVATIDPNSSQAVVNMTMNSEGATEWARITGANIGKRIAIILDGVVYNAPVVKNKIPGGRSVIEGMENLQEAKLLEIVLKAGALPAPVDIIEERTVGPSLGEDSINSGLISVIIGYLLVGVFMIIYYQRSGTITALALLFTILFILGILAGFNATLTLPGIAGIILTIGMAVDANVLIFERIREEMATGKTIKASIDSGFARAYSAIIDSNITTFFTGIILYQFGTGPVQGFALTLMIGILASLFSALVIVRVVMDIFVSKGYKVTVG